MMLVPMEVVALGLLMVLPKVTYFNCTCDMKMHKYASRISRIILLLGDIKLIRALSF